MNELVKGLNESAKKIHENNKSKGFWSNGQSGQNVGELLMLIVSELGEAMEAHRKSNFTNMSDFETGLDAFSNFGSSFQAHVKDTFEDEIADSVIRLLDLSAGLGIDLERHINLKVAYNLSRPQLHGKSY
jgi:NTP pyrophosphatase (non-canonical NTP hydrolase)